jgi:hypothetical protein
VAKLSPALQRGVEWNDDASPGEPALSEIEGTDVLTHTVKDWNRPRDGKADARKRSDHTGGLPAMR